MGVQGTFLGTRKNVILERVVQRAFESSRQCMNSQSNARRQLKQEDKPTGDVIHTHTHTFNVRRSILGVVYYYWYR